MNKIIYTILAMAALTSCANSYNIQGTSNVSMLDGRMLYLKVYNKDNLKNVDSCDVVHGQFHFTGSVDSAKMAILFMDDESIMPMVIESGEITVKLDNMNQKVSGTPLNDKLTKFNEDYTKLQNRMGDLGHKQSQAIMDGEDEQVTNQRCSGRRRVGDFVHRGELRQCARPWRVLHDYCRLPVPDAPALDRGLVEQSHRQLQERRLCEVVLRESPAERGHHERHG